MTTIRNLASDFKNLGNLLSRESNIPRLMKDQRDILKSLESMSKENLDACTTLSGWGSNEFDDLKNITAVLAHVQGTLSSALGEWVAGTNEFYARLSQIRDKENELTELKKRLDSASNGLELARKKNRPTDGLERTVEELTRNRNIAEAELVGFKRLCLKAGLLAQFSGIKSFCDQALLVSTFGTYLAQQIPQGSPEPGFRLPEFTGYATTERIKSDFNASLGLLTGQSKPSSVSHDVVSDKPRPASPVRTEASRANPRANESAGASVDTSGTSNIEETSAGGHYTASIVEPDQISNATLVNSLPPVDSPSTTLTQPVAVSKRQETASKKPLDLSPGSENAARTSFLGKVGIFVAWTAYSAEQTDELSLLIGDIISVE
ncbi:uncharacterized protein BJ171DRAFT_309583 [Polychytrium aggregatum]|uniref:uncharacterized protein n=1 Tax=Polychytrium aggregatum TaxID=110093 RepID=UPI0022FE2229|nr:uncharacterized protein BJ171DRAFT_309583 [Polychytrium aggregatum]KAI9206964.1 hypothetical protein BJ171DRAFT_309583 [Polychytrium aggregatum]